MNKEGYVLFRAWDGEQKVYCFANSKELLLFVFDRLWCQKADGELLLEDFPVEIADAFQKMKFEPARMPLSLNPDTRQFSAGTREADLKLAEDAGFFKRSPIEMVNLIQHIEPYDSVWYLVEGRLVE